uniref:O-methyltransferase ZRP4 n=1 Tax=Zea mays TaxID=4577 RepID=A0A804Q4S6_MAIZE
MTLSKKQGAGTDQQALLDAQLQLWHHTIAFVKSMALKAAVDLRIADAIHLHGGSATLSQIVTKVTLHPSKIPCLRRLMRVLTLTGVFSVNSGAVVDEPVYGLTPASRLLVGPGLNQTPFLTLMLSTFFVSSFLGLDEWFQHETGPSPFELANGRDSGFIMDVVVKECGDVFRGVGSLVDVAGGLGGATQTIAKAFPDVACSVLDLSHVVANAPTDTTVKYIAGDMFESIPSANVVFLKWILHDWGDAECVKILKNCKKAIASQEEGKVVILDMVVGAGSSDEKHVETQIVFDLFMMFINGTERDETEWKKIIFEAGFSRYKIIPVLGVRSIIEVYP